MRPGTTVPRLLSKKNPKYPPSSRDARVEGTVVLYVVISSAGVPSDILVYRPVTPELDPEAIKTVQQWRFSQEPRAGSLRTFP
jgi:TonB family protein